MITLTSTDTTNDHALAAAVKTHLRVDGTADDAYIADLLSDVIDVIEEETGQDFLERTWDESYPIFPNTKFALTKMPVNTITSISYYDTDGTSQTLATGKYQLVNSHQAPAHVYKVSNQVFPCAFNRPDAITIRYTTGYSTANLPKTFVRAVLLLCGSWFENREDESAISTKSLTMGVQSLTDKLKWSRYA